MKTHTLLAIALALACAPLNAAQLYRWVDDKGNVEWRDTPPPPTAKKVEKRTVGSNTIQTSTLPYSLQQAVKNFPVTLWTFDCGDPCNKARAHLARRGIPYTERDAQKEPDALKKAVGGLEVPVLVVGARQLKGYLESEWDAALDTAGYPKTALAGTKPQASAPKTGGTSGSKRAPDAAAKGPAAASPR